MQTINLTPSNFDGNTEFLMPKISKQLIPFNKMLTRQPINNINKAVTNDSVIYDNIDKFRLQNSKYKKSPCPNFNKALSRGSTTEGALPSFMEGVHDRNSINMLSKKMLETNHFSEGNFQSIVSSFAPKQSFNKLSQTTFGSPHKMSQSGQHFNSKLLVLGESSPPLGSEQEGMRSKKFGQQDEKITFNQILSKTGFLKGSQSQQEL
mmetsp:Transcript_41291/g.39767  ORF Transcript_41291/g.39767 Transcript_41291/m.39767 type:complete len:207 (-) Transcript_41291:28-648(-)